MWFSHAGGAQEFHTVGIFPVTTSAAAAGDHVTIGLIGVNVNQRSETLRTRQSLGCSTVTMVFANGSASLTSPSPRWTSCHGN